MANSLIGFQGATVGIVGDIDTVLRNPLGTLARTDDGNVWIYLKGVASTAEGDWVTYNAATYQTVRLIADAVGMVAIAPAAILAANWGWYLRCGFYTTANSDTVSAAGGLWIDGTTGRVDDLSVAGDFVYGALALGADTTNKLSVHISYPWVQNIAAT